MTAYHRQFLQYVDQWINDLAAPTLSDISPFPQKTALFSVDVINGFCTQGALSSPRVQNIVNPITNLITAAWDHGIRNIVLTQDTHEPDAFEFGSFPPHCIRGTAEAESVPEFKSQPFYTQMTILEKNSIHSGIDTGLNEWMAAHAGVDTFIVVGDCTDLCIYQLAMYLRLDANARHLQRRVIIPANCVDTYDMPVKTAVKIGAMPHDGDLLHAIFLYHMALNGIEIVTNIH
jgi:nicotinamidase-related amidase